MYAARGVGTDGVGAGVLSEVCGGAGAGDNARIDATRRNAEHTRTRALI